MTESDFNFRFNHGRERKKQKISLEIIEQPKAQSGSFPFHKQPNINISKQLTIEPKSEVISSQIENTTIPVLLSKISRTTEEPSKSYPLREKPVENLKSESTDKNHVFIESFTIKTIDEEIKEIAVREYPNDYLMQEHTYKRQAESKAFMGMTADEEIKEIAIKEYPNDYFMQEHTFKRQAESKAFMEKTADEEIKEIAIKEYPNNYFMQEHTFKRQAESKAFMGVTADEEIKEIAVKKYPNDYFMQEYFYKEQITLAPHNRQTKKNQLDNTIIEVNSEKLDLKVERNTIQNEVQMVPPYWAQTYVYSYDELRNANQAQKEYYYYLKNKVLNGEIVDIQGFANYAFILYFDFLNEYQNHRDIKLLEEHFKLIGQICPKTKSYTSFLLRNELRKRNDSYSVDKLKNLEEPNYRFDYDHSDYNPDLYKLGNKYKDKLGLDKQEINWLNKFYNPSNVFLSIEGCCIATIRQYVTVLKELDKRFKKAETTLAKEITYFKDKLKSIYANRNSAWGYYDATYFVNQAESEVYLVLFKRVENSVRDSFGHKRKVSGDFTYTDKDFSEEFEKRIGSLYNELIGEFKSKLGKPDLETQIALNLQNVARWQIEFDELKKSFNPELKNNFVEGIIHLEETNQKNPNIENIFFEASKFIAMYDKVQSLSYFAKYIYYDLKSKSFDNKELAKTVQKSLFKTQEQLDDFKTIIAELIKTSDIQTALERITKIYVPKRKKIHLDKSEIEEVEQKHEGTVELLNGYLNSEKEEAITQINTTTDEDIEVTIIPIEENNSIFISEISIGKVQEELIKRIVTNSFKIHQVEVNNFANENQMFKNQLIDSINESFAEYLDGEALIEEDGDIYIMEESYFKVITK